MQTVPPGPFLGSMPSPDIGGARLARQLDLVCSCLAILAGASVWLGAWLGGGLAAGTLALVNASSAVLLAASLLGLVLMANAAGWERLGTAIILEAVGRQLRLHQASRAVRLGPQEKPASGIAGLVEAVVWRVRRLNAPPSRRPEPVDLYDTALREGRAQARQIVKALYQDADMLSETSDEIETVTRHLVAGGQQAGTACAAAESAIDRTEQHLISLTGAVTATTSELRRVTEAAITLSERAFASQRGVAALDDNSARLIAGIETIESLVKRVGVIGQSAVSEVSMSGGAGAALVPIAAAIQDLAQGMLASVAALHAEAAGMSGQVSAALASAQEICDWVTAQYDLGLALSHAIGRQSDEITAILRSLEEARSGFVTLRASVEAVTRQGPAGLATTGTLRQAAGRLPAHADAVTAILRDLPDFAPSFGSDH